MCSGIQGPRQRRGLSSVVGAEKATGNVGTRWRLISGFSGRQVSAGGEQVDSEFGKGHWGPEVADCRDYQGQRDPHTVREAHD